MNNIIWTLPDGSTSVTGLAASGNQEVADQLQADGVVPSDWVASAFDSVPPLQVITPEQLLQLVSRSVDAKLDALAKSWRYRNYVSARAYAGDANPKYDAEGAAIAAYGSACWTRLDQLEADVLAGRVVVPGSVDEVLALLPAEPSRPVCP